MIPWTEKENIALFEYWVERLAQYTPRDRSGPFWGRVFHQLCIHRDDTTRTVDALSLRFRTTRLYILRFETVHDAVQNDGGDLSEEGVIQVAPVDYMYKYNLDFKHVSG
ncbi:hypothetical protein Hanom_Chr12g01168181 [Helianthus anomalus]